MPRRQHRQGVCPLRTAPARICMRAAPGTLAITNSTCTNCTLSGGTIALGTVNGSAEPCSSAPTEGRPGAPTLPAYDQDGPAQTIHASVLSANGCRSAMIRQRMSERQHAGRHHGTGRLHNAGSTHGHAGHHQQHLHELHAERRNDCPGYGERKRRDLAVQHRRRSDLEYNFTGL